jgi:SAM-dependent methyltransferase
MESVDLREVSKGYHETRLAYDARRDVLWKTLCAAFFQRLVPEDGCTLELGAGYGHFINHIRCARRIALDRWEGMLEHLEPGVEGIVADVTDLRAVEPRSVDFVFASNLFEHLAQPQFASVLEQLREKFRPGGTLSILQPNYRFAYREYFDDYTHVAAYSDRSLADFLTAHGYRIIDCCPRFLPLTVKSALPVSPLLIRLYLALPFKPMGKQMLIEATPE